MQWKRKDKQATHPNTNSGKTKDKTGPTTTRTEKIWVKKGQSTPMSMTDQVQANGKTKPRQPKTTSQRPNKKSHQTVQRWIKKTNLHYVEQKYAWVRKHVLNRETFKKDLPTQKTDQQTGSQTRSNGTNTNQVKQIWVPSTSTQRQAAKKTVSFSNDKEQVTQ